MKKTRRTTEQIIRILRESEGLSVDEACRKHEISAPTYHRCKAKYGGMGIKEAQRLRDLEKENSELKNLAALVQLQFRAHPLRELHEEKPEQDTDGQMQDEWMETPEKQKQAVAAALVQWNEEKRH